MTEHSGGLADVIAGDTAICTVGKQGRGLSYRGYAIEDLAAGACFEEVAYLLLYGELPGAAQLDAYLQRLSRLRSLPEALKSQLEILPANSHPMDVLRSGCSLHGGANEATMAFINDLTDPDTAEAAVLAALASHRKVMGFGHRVYRESDPRNTLIKTWSRRLADDTGDSRLFAVSERIEQVMWREKKLFANLDFYSASVYHFLEIPVSLYTPVFVCARMAGWAAHVMEQRQHNRLIRPTSNYIGPDKRPFVPLEQRT